MAASEIETSSNGRACRRKSRAPIRFHARGASSRQSSGELIGSRRRVKLACRILAAADCNEPVGWSSSSLILTRFGCQHDNAYLAA